MIRLCTLSMYIKILSHISIMECQCSLPTSAAGKVGATADQLQEALEDDPGGATGGYRETYDIICVYYTYCLYIIGRSYIVYIYHTIISTLYIAYIYTIYIILSW